MGWTATRGQRASVARKIRSDTSQGSSMELSEYTRMPLHPICSLQQATFSTLRRYSVPETAVSERGQVEKISTSLSLQFNFVPPVENCSRTPIHESTAPALSGLLMLPPQADRNFNRRSSG